MSAPARIQSEELAARALRVLPGGTNSNVRLDALPTFFHRGRGAWLWDVDGNDYIDYLLGQGPAFLGHAPAEIWLAVEQACQNGLTFGAQHLLEVEAAEHLVGALGWPEMVRFGSTGTEMVQAALRLARATTGRRRFVRFEGHYHGWLDNLLLAPNAGQAIPGSAGQPAEALADQILLPWNDEQALADTMHEQGDEIAAVIMEPVMLNAGSIEPQPGYLARTRALCDANDSLLIFDEVISGFRIAFGGAVERYGTVPDLAIYGKALGGGWPVAALAGSSDLMGRFGTREVNHSGTFNANVMAAAAVASTLTLLKREPPYERIELIGETLMDGLRTLAIERSIPLRVAGLPSAFHVSFGDEVDVRDFRSLQLLDLSRYAQFAKELTHHGVWVAPRGIWYVSAAHGETEVELTLERVAAALPEM